jgi:hypothetical protein
VSGINTDNRKILFINLSHIFSEEAIPNSNNFFIVSYVLARIRDPTIGIRANSCFEHYWFDTCEVSASSAVVSEAF